MSIRERRVGLAITVAALVAAPAIGLMVSAADLTMREALLIANAVAIAVPFAWYTVRERFDIASPILWALAALALVFVVRPVVDMSSGYAFRGSYDLTPQFDLALTAGLVAITACVIGYALPFGVAWAERTPALPSRVDPAVTTIFAFVLCGGGAAAYAIYAARAGGSFLDLAGQGFIASMTVSTAYLYLAPFVAFPAMLLLLQRALEGRSVWPVPVIALLVTSFALVLAPAGQRLWLMLLVAPFLIYPVLRTGYRPGPVLVVGLAAIAVPITVSMRDLLPGQGFTYWVESIQKIVANPLNAYYQFAAGPDTEMFDGLALGMQEVPAHLPFQPFSSLTSLIFHPIPREFWAEKPTTLDGVVDVMLFTDLQSGAASVAHSVVGNFFYDSGLIGVAIGMLTVGVALRYLFAYYRANAGNDQVRLAYASSLPLVIVLFRGNLPDTLARALFTVGPLILVALIAGVRTPQRRLVARPAGNG